MDLLLMMYFTHNSHHTEDDCNDDQNMLVRTLSIKYVINIELRLLVIYISWNCYKMLHACRIK